MLKTRRKTDEEPVGLTADKIIAMTDAERAKIISDIENETTEEMLARSTPLTPRQRRNLRKARRLQGRPKHGKHGTKIVSVTVEKGLLKLADSYAKRHGLKRSELVDISLRATIGAK